MEIQELKHILEAVLLCSSEPVSLERMADVFEEWEKPSKDTMEHALELLKEDYITRSFELVLISGGYKLQTKAAFSSWVGRFQSEKPAKYSRALLETLAIIAYKQPVTRADIEELRGVSVNSNVMKTLLEREWIRVAGHKDVPGKPAVYTTTRDFLHYFNLQSLKELPALIEDMEPLTLPSDYQNKEECHTQ